MSEPQPQQQYMQQPHPQAMPPVQPANVYQPPAQNPEATHPTPQVEAHQVLPPTYDQSKAASQGMPVPGAGFATVVPLNMLGDQPQPIDCPFCRQRTMTEIRREGSSMQIIVGALFCLVCVCLTCVPCLAGWFEDMEYRCSQCKNMVARRRHDGPLELLGPQVAVYSQYAHQPQMNPQQQQAAPVQTKNVSAFVQPIAHPQQYDIQPQQSQIQYQQQPQQYHYPQQVQEIQPVYHQQQFVQSPTPQLQQK
ncbi:hypothetical protein NQ176_g5016 [Zarea fungicola]|uniref:Uncharacterized protein n=1 Tax=Zarea fungicola TaxID=93591 RepID=A0ACC1NCW1_9HYPO|nr:hypothetical protein NQ176_g5016 [Lecanicillium fungicola]